MKFIWNWLFKPKAVESTFIVEPEPKKEPELVVGEPIISFVELVKSNPKRFKMRERMRIEHSQLISRFLISDKLTKEWFWCEKWESPYGYNMKRNVMVMQYKYAGNPSFLTQDEWKYIELHLKRDYNAIAAARYGAIKTAKADRLSLEARQRLIDVYCTK